MTAYTVVYTLCILCFNNFADEMEFNQQQGTGQATCEMCFQSHQLVQCHYLSGFALSLAFGDMPFGGHIFIH